MGIGNYSRARRPDSPRVKLRRCRRIRECLCRIDFTEILSIILSLSFAPAGKLKKLLIAGHPVRGGLTNCPTTIQFNDLLSRLHSFIHSLLLFHTYCLHLVSLSPCQLSSPHWNLGSLTHVRQWTSTILLLYASTVRLCLVSAFVASNLKKPNGFLSEHRNFYTERIL